MRTSLAFIVLAWAGVAYIIYALFDLVLVKRRNVKKARQLGCEEPPFQANSLPFGFDQLLRALKADKERQFPTDTIKRTVDTGAITYKYSMLGVTNIFTADEKNLQALLATQFADFDLGPHRRGNFMPMLGFGIFTQDGAAWEHSRAMMRPQFAREQVSDLDLEERHVQHLMMALDLALQPSNWTVPIDLQLLFFRLTLDTATEFLFGSSTNSQTAGLPGANRTSIKGSGPDGLAFATAFDKGQMALATRTRFQKRYWLVWPKGFGEACKTSHEFIDHFVRLALSKKLQNRTAEKWNGGKERYIFLEALASQTQDPIELRSQLLHILLAGRDTTASLLGWLFYCLARDPARYTKLRGIILEEFGTYENPRDVSFTRLKSCTYLQHCMNETLRVYPVVPVNGRYANKDTTLPRGGGVDGKSKIFIPKGTAVDYSVHVMHHRKDIWGEDAELWKPERWVGRRVGWEFLPFNGGPRICIGQQFALTEASYVTVRLLQRFDKVENLDPERAMHNLTLTNCSANGVKVVLHSAV